MIEQKIWKSYAKVNVFLKVVGIRDNYHELSSRFIRFDDLYDEILFVGKSQRDYKHLLGRVENIVILKKIMIIEGNFGCELENNTIFKTGLKLLEYLEENEKIDFFDRVCDFLSKNKIVVKKNIPIGAGLGGGSSNAGIFLKILNEILELNLTIDILNLIGSKIGADVNFFLSGFYSANVRGIGERIEEFDEDVIKLEIYTPNLVCFTKDIFVNFRNKFWNKDNLDIDFVRSLEIMTTKEILLKYENDQLNDLLVSSLDLCPELLELVKNGWFLSGSGSSFFRIKK